MKTKRWLICVIVGTMLCLNNGCSTTTVQSVSTTQTSEDESILETANNIETSSQMVSSQEDFDLEEKIVISSENEHPIFYDNDNILISIKECQYTEDASHVRILLNVDNHSQSIIELEFSDIEVDGVQMNMLGGNIEEYKVGGYGSNFYITLEDLENSGVTDFDIINCTISGRYNNGEELFNRDVTIERSAFIPYK